MFLTCREPRRDQDEGKRRMDTVKDYYAMLGVTHTEGAEGIHQAFRRLAKQCHPDRAGAQGAGRFRAIQEAYEVLSDPQQKQQYDDARDGSHTRVTTAPEPLLTPGPRTNHPEPLTMPSDRRGSEVLRGAFRHEIGEFARIVEVLLSPVLLSPELNDDEEDFLRLYIGQLLDR